MIPQSERLHATVYELRIMIENIDVQIDEIKRTYPDPYVMRDLNGRFLVADLLASKANVYVAISHLIREIAAAEKPLSYNEITRREPT